MYIYIYLIKWDLVARYQLKNSETNCRNICSTTVYGKLQKKWSTAKLQNELPFYPKHTYILGLGKLVPFVLLWSTSLKYGKQDEWIYTIKISIIKRIAMKHISGYPKLYKFHLFIFWFSKYLTRKRNSLFYQFFFQIPNNEWSSINYVLKQSSSQKNNRYLKSL